MNNSLFYDLNGAVYLDNAAGTQIPKQVLNAVNEFYKNGYSNIYRSNNKLGNIISSVVESTRANVAQFINAKYNEEIIFTYSTTDGINCIAKHITTLLNSDDNVVVSELEHHSNLIPWQECVKASGTTLQVIPVNNCGRLLDYKNIINSNTRVLALTYVSNIIGAVNPIDEIVKYCRELRQDMIIVIDAAQAVGHIPVDVQNIDCDFLVFSGYKVYALTGIGVMYGKKYLLNTMSPYRYGSAMVSQTTQCKATYQSTPYRFEGGTLNIAGIISLNEAINFIRNIGISTIMKHEETMMKTLLNILNEEGVIIYKPNSCYGSLVSFSCKEKHYYDLGIQLSTKGIYVRTGHCCAQPLMTKFGVEGVVRLSLSLQNDLSDVDKFGHVLHTILSHYI